MLPEPDLLCAPPAPTPDTAAPALATDDSRTAVESYPHKQVFAFGTAEGYGSRTTRYRF